MASWLPGPTSSVLKKSQAGVSTTVAPSYTNSLIKNFAMQENQAISANKARENEIRSIYSDILNSSGNAARAAGEFEIAQQEKQAIGQGTQQLISSGLYGTTTAAALPIQAKAASQVSRLKLEDVLQQRTNEARLNMANFIERIQNPYPSYDNLISALAAANS